MVLLPIGKTLKDVLSGFEVSPKAADQKSIDDFLEKFSSEAEQAGLHPEFAAEQIFLIPKKYRRLKTTNPGIRHSDENGIFTPFSLVDHLALVRYSGFNLFDLLDDDTGYTTLEINGEKFYFVLMRNIPIADLAYRGKKAEFQYRLGIWSRGQLVGYRNHYVNENCPITPSFRSIAIEGSKGIDVNFFGQSKELDLSLEGLNENGLWVDEKYRRRRIGYTMENITSDFIPNTILGIDYVVADPEGFLSFFADVDTSGRRKFYDETGYEDDLSRGSTVVKRSLSGNFPKILIVPSDHKTILQRLQEQSRGIDSNYSPTWQYARLLSLEKRTI